MKKLCGIIFALVVMTSCATSQSLMTTMSRNGTWYLALGSTDRLIYIMGVIDGSNTDTSEFTVDQIKGGLDEFFADPKNASTVMAADAFPIVIRRIKSETRR
jgi:hypothetical protein